MKILKDLKLSVDKKIEDFNDLTILLRRWFSGEELHPAATRNQSELVRAQVFVEERVIKDYYDSPYEDFFYYWADHYKYWEDVCDTTGLDFYLVASSQRILSLVEISRPGNGLF